MEASTNIQAMLSDGFIFVPNYQRAYSWDQEKQVAVFLSDIEQYVQSKSKSKYYFGHFLFEKVGEKKYGVVDGQQRLTTIVIFLSALYKQLKGMRDLTEEEEFEYSSMIRLASHYRFSTVDYDNQLFKEYVIDGTKKDKIGLKTESEKRIVAAYDFFSSKLSLKSEEDLLALYSAVKSASCSTIWLKMNPMLFRCLFSRIIEERSQRTWKSSRLSLCSTSTFMEERKLTTCLAI